MVVDREGRVRGQIGRSGLDLYLATLAQSGPIFPLGSPALCCVMLKGGQASSIPAQHLMPKGRALWLCDHSESGVYRAVWSQWN